MDPELFKWFVSTVKDTAKFIHQNYAPFADWHEDDVDMYILPSVLAGTVLGVDVAGELVAIGEYWRITPKYLKLIRNIRTNDDWLNYLPSEEDRSGDGSIIFFPLAVYKQGWENCNGILTKLIAEKVKRLYPDVDGYWRWVLKDERAKFIKFKKGPEPKEE